MTGGHGDVVLITGALRKQTVEARDFLVISIGSDHIGYYVQFSHPEKDADVSYQPSDSLDPDFALSEREHARLERLGWHRPEPDVSDKPNWCSMSAQTAGPALVANAPRRFGLPSVNRFGGRRGSVVATPVNRLP
jgi:T3SS (YopN, CesT) and YbjN peptide-binding chaperone 3